MDQIIDQVEVVPIERIHERESGSVPIAETDHAGSAQRNDTGRERGDQQGAGRPGMLQSIQRLPKPAQERRIRCDQCDRLAAGSIDQGIAQGQPSVSGGPGRPDPARRDVPPSALAGAHLDRQRPRAARRHESSPARAAHDRGATRLFRQLPTDSEGSKEISTVQSHIHASPPLCPFEVRIEAPGYRPGPLPRSGDPLARQARHQPQRFPHDSACQPMAEAPETRMKSGRVRDAAGKEIFRVMMLVELPFALCQQRRGEGGTRPPAALPPQLPRHVEKIDQVIDLLDPAGNLPARVRVKPERPTQRPKVLHR